MAGQTKAKLSRLHLVRQLGQPHRRLQNKEPGDGARNLGIEFHLGARVSMAGGIAERVFRESDKVFKRESGFMGTANEGAAARSCGVFFHALWVELDDGSH